MGLRILFLYSILWCYQAEAQYVKFLPVDTILNVDLWTHLSRKQLPDYITPELKDSLYSCQIEKRSSKSAMIYLLEFDTAIDSQLVNCKFKNDHITFEQHTEIRGNPFTWGIATLRRKMNFNSFYSVQYISKTRSRKFLFFIWPGIYKKQDVDREFQLLNLWGR